ncbi:hypothetical protein C8R43DRAFT_1133818 [Mycena crocata]|nr:hypothetical protein C8R43DRAFT_1133818 [Mycena crocata]
MNTPPNTPQRHQQRRQQVRDAHAAQSANEGSPRRRHPATSTTRQPLAAHNGQAGHVAGLSSNEVPAPSEAALRQRAYRARKRAERESQQEQENTGPPSAAALRQRAYRARKRTENGDPGPSLNEVPAPSAAALKQREYRARKRAEKENPQPSSNEVPAPSAAALKQREYRARKRAERESQQEQVNTGPGGSRTARPSRQPRVLQDASDGIHLDQTRKGNEPMVRDCQRHLKPVRRRDRPPDNRLGEILLIHGRLHNKLGPEGMNNISQKLPGGAVAFGGDVVKLQAGTLSLWQRAPNIKIRRLDTLSAAWTLPAATAVLALASRGDQRFHYPPP